MAIAFSSQGNGASSNTSGGSLAVPFPAAVAANDILIFHKAIGNTTTAFADISGTGFVLLSGPNAAGTSARSAVYGKLAVGDEDGTNLAGGSEATANNRSGRIYSFSGYASGAIYEVVAGFRLAAGTTQAVADTPVTTYQDGSVACNAIHAADDNTMDVLAGMSGGTWAEAAAEYTSSLGTGSDCMLSLQIATMATAGTIGGGAGNQGAADPWTNCGFVVQPDKQPTPNVVRAPPEVTPSTAGIPWP